VLLAKNVKLSSKSASADHVAADAYKAPFLKIINDNGYVPEKLFNADESAMF